MIQRASESEYSVRSGDIDHIRQSCDESKYLVCLTSPDLDVAIPATPPTEGSTWSIRSSTSDYRSEFSLEAIGDGVSWLGTQLDRLYVIKVTRIFGDSEPRHFVLVFSYLQGLIAFEDRVDGRHLLYVASELPSFGSSQAR